MDQGDYIEAIEAFKALLKQKKSTEVRYQLCLCYGQIEDFDSCIIELDALLEEDRSIGHYWHLKAHSLLRLGKSKEALQAIDNALYSDRTNEDYWGTKTVIYFTLGDDSARKRTVQSRELLAQLNPLIREEKIY